jgi:hypothetical protein
LAEATVGSRDGKVRYIAIFRATLRKRCLPQLEHIRELAERYPGNADFWEESSAFLTQESFSPLVGAIFPFVLDRKTVSY